MIFFGHRHNKRRWERCGNRRRLFPTCTCVVQLCGPCAVFYRPEFDGHSRRLIAGSTTGGRFVRSFSSHPASLVRVSLNSHHLSRRRRFVAVISRRCDTPEGEEKSKFFFSRVMLMCYLRLCSLSKKKADADWRSGLRRWRLLLNHTPNILASKLTDQMVCDCKKLIIKEKRDTVIGLFRLHYVYLLPAGNSC